jgi:RNA polymerase sigma-70 factor (ECF subfamily)
MPFSSTRLSSLDQKELIQRANTFDKEALAAIFDIFYEPIYQYIYRHARDDKAAEDLASEVFHQFLESLNTRHGPKKSLKAWLYRTAHNLIIEKAQPDKSYNFGLPGDEYEDDTEVVSQQAENSIRNQALIQALRQLTDKQQEVIYLRFFQGLRLEEVAYALNMTLGTVKSLQHRGLQSMRRYLQDFEEYDGKDL